MQLCEVQKMKDISMIKDKTNERREYQMSASMFQLLSSYLSNDARIKIPCFNERFLSLST